MVLLYEEMIRAITADSRGGRADLFLGRWAEITLSCEVLTAFGKLCFVRVTGLAFFAAVWLFELGPHSEARMGGGGAALLP